MKHQFLPGFQHKSYAAFCLCFCICSDLDTHLLYLFHMITSYVIMFLFLIDHFFFLCFWCSFPCHPLGFHYFWRWQSNKVMVVIFQLHWQTDRSYIFRWWFLFHSSFLNGRKENKTFAFELLFEASIVFSEAWICFFCIDWQNGGGSSPVPLTNATISDVLAVWYQNCWRCLFITLEYKKEGKKNFGIWIFDRASGL